MAEKPSGPADRAPRLEVRLTPDQAETLAYLLREGRRYRMDSLLRRLTGYVWTVAWRSVVALVAGSVVLAGCGGATKTVTAAAPPAASTTPAIGPPPALEHLQQEAQKRLKALEREGRAHKRLETAEARRRSREAAPEGGESAKEEAEEAKKEAEEAKEEAEQAKQEAEEAKEHSEGH